MGGRIRLQLPQEVRRNMQIVKNSTIYLGSSIFNKMIPFLLLPIMTQYLTLKEYGTLSIYLILITLYSAFIGMGLHTNISKNFFKISKAELSLYIGNMLIILTITFCIYLLISYFISLKYDTLFSIPTNWILVIPFISLMVMVNEMNTTILRNEQRAYMFGIFEISNTLIKMGMTILFLLIFSYGWYSQIIGTIIGATVFFIIGVIYMYQRNYILLIPNREKIKSILKISLPLIPHVLASVIIAVSDRLFIEKMVSIEEVGIYSVGYMFGMIVMLFSDAFVKAWSPWFYKNLVSPTPNKKKRIVKYTYIYIIGIFTLSLFISMVGIWVLPYFVDEKFYRATEYILWVSLGYAMFGVYQIFFPYLVHINKTSFLAISSTLAAIINLVLNYFLIDLYGAIGAVYATFIAFLVSATLVFLYQKRNYSMPWSLKV